MNSRFTYDGDEIVVWFEHYIDCPEGMGIVSRLLGIRIYQDMLHSHFLYGICASLSYTQYLISIRPLRARGALVVHRLFRLGPGSLAWDN